MPHDPSNLAPARPAGSTSLPPLPATGLPPRGDPRRPVLLAYRSLRIACVLLLLLSAFTIWGTFNEATRKVTLLDYSINVGFYAIPGLIYFICAWAILQRRQWAVFPALIVALLQLAFCGRIFLALTILYFRPAAPPKSETLPLLILIAICILFLAQLIWQLLRSLPSLHRDPSSHG